MRTLVDVPCQGFQSRLAEAESIEYLVDLGNDLLSCEFSLEIAFPASSKEGKEESVVYFAVLKLTQQSFYISRANLQSLLNLCNNLAQPCPTGFLACDLMQKQLYFLSIWPQRFPQQFKPPLTLHYRLYILEKAL